jgi:hypothetical protein
MVESQKPKRTAVESAASARLIQAGRRRFQHLLGATGQRYDAGYWDLQSLKREMVSSAPRNLRFTSYQHRSLLPGTFVEVVKAWLVLRYSAVATMWTSLQAAKYLWETLEQRHGADFDWTQLSEADFNEMEVWLRARFAPSTVRSTMSCILSLIDFLAAHNVCRPHFYAVQTPPSASFDKQTLAGQEAGAERLPSQRALQGLADLYGPRATAPPERLLLAAVALLTVTGFRVGELVTLPEACEVREMRNGETVYGLRYYKEKARRREMMLAVRWLSSLQAELAQKAVREIRQLTAGARKQARVLEAHPDRVPIPGYAPDERIDSKALAEILGLKSWRSIRCYAKSDLPCDRRPGESRYHYRVGDVEAFLLRLRQTPLWVLDRGDGTRQWLSETLFVFPRNFLDRRNGSNRLLVEPLRVGQLQRFLASVFERFNIREEDGSYCQITSHQFRHWLNDLADKGGMPVDSISRWLGRDSRQQTDTYRHATPDERLRWVKQGIQDGQLQGAVAGAYFALPLAERDSFLEGQVQAVHVTPMGICVHDFAVEPCPYHLNCLRGCPDYLRTRGDDRERRHLLRLKADTEEALAHVQRLAIEEGSVTVQAWVDHHEQTLRGIEAALAVDDTGGSDGSGQRYISLPVVNGMHSERGE